jgi:cytidylate kinase
MRFHDIVQRAAKVRQPPEAGEIGPYLTVSRQAGSGGSRVARLVGERLGWSVLDKELVQELAQRLQLAPELMTLMDETSSNWFSETLLNLMNSRLVLQDSYVAMAGKVMALTAYHEPVVLVGRGANLMLPRESGVSVRIVAPRNFCINEVQRQDGIDEKTARGRVEEIDRGRRDFVKRHFDRDIDDMELYDLVVDTEAFGVEGASALILRALELRGLTEAGEG